MTDKIQTSIQSIDDRLAHFYGKNPHRFMAVLGLHCLGRFLGVFEIYLIGFFLHLPLGLDGALFLASLTVLINIVFVFIPGSLGVMEGGYGALFHLMGLMPIHGVALQLVRRLRTVVWIFIGLVFMIGPRNVGAGSPGPGRGDRAPTI